MTRTTRNIKEFAASTIAMTLACAAGTNATAQAAVGEVRQIASGVEPVVFHPVRGSGKSTYLVIAPGNAWPQSVVADAGQAQSTPPETFDDLGDLFSDIATPETDRLTAQLRRQLGETDVGEAVSLQQLRLQAGLSQKQLAAMLESDQGYVSKLERGLYPDPSLARARGLAMALGVGIEAIDLAFRKFNLDKDNG